MTAGKPDRDAGRKDAAPVRGRRVKPAVAAIGVLFLLLLSGVGLALTYRTALLEWAIEATLAGDTVKSVTMDVTAFDSDLISIRNLRIEGDRTVSVGSIRLEFDLDSLIGGTVGTARAAGIRIDRRGTVVGIKEIVGDGGFALDRGGLRTLQFGLDILGLNIGGHPFQPGRIDIAMQDDRLSLDGAILAADGFVTFVGDGTLRQAADGFRMWISGRIDAAPVTALFGTAITASGPVKLAVSGATDDPLFFLRTGPRKSKFLPDRLSLKGLLDLHLTALRVGGTDLPTGYHDRINFTLEDFISTERSATAALTLALDADRRDAAGFGFERAAVDLTGTLSHAGNRLTLALNASPLVQLQSFRLGEGSPVDGDMSFRLIGKRNEITVDMAKGSTRHRLHGRLDWNAGRIAVRSEGDLEHEADPLVVTLRGAFDATPFLGLHPALKGTRGEATVFLAARISQALKAITSGTRDRRWPGAMRLDGAFKLALEGLTIPGMPAYAMPADSIEITLKGFNGSSGHQRGRLKLTASLDGRRYNGLRFGRARLDLDGRFDIGGKGYVLMPTADSALTLAEVSTETGFYVPEELAFQLTGKGNHITVGRDLDFVDHNLTFAHLEADGVLRAAEGGTEQPIRITIPQFGSRKVGPAPYHLYATGAAVELPALRITARGINLSVEQRPDGADFGVEAADIRHGGNPPAIAPMTVSAKGSIVGNAIAAAVQATQRYGPLRLRGSLQHDLRRRSGRLDFETPAIKIAPKQYTLADLYPPGAAWFDDVHGGLSLRGQLSWTAKALAGRMRVKLDGLSLASKNLRLEKIAGIVEFSDLAPPAMPPRQRLKGSISYGKSGPIPARLDFQLRGDGSVAIQHLEMKAAGGRLTGRGLLKADKGLRGTVTLGAKAVDLKRLLRIIGVKGLRGSGRLNGTMPLEIAAGTLRVRKGRLVAVGPGRLRYSAPATGKRLSARSHSADTIAAVLSDFRYRTLSMQWDKPAGGGNAIRLRMKGTNPKVKSVHPFAFNIRIDSDLVTPGRIVLGGIQTISDTRERPGKGTDAE